MTRLKTHQLIRQLQQLKKSVLEDGKIDWDETEQLREAIRPLSVRRGFIFEDYERLLMKCRKDGKITPDESRQLALQLDFLCSEIANQRLRFWLTVVLFAFVLVCSFALVNRIASSTDASALGEPTVEAVPENP